MNRSLALILALSLVALIQGCAKDKRSAGSALVASGEQMISYRKPDKSAESQNSSPAPGSPEEEKEELNESQKQAANVTLTCEDKDCNPSVGVLSIVTKTKDGWGLGQCTASLVGSDTLVTNGHCVPADIASTGSSCRNRLWITFPDDPNHPEYDRQIPCSQVLLRRKVEGLDGVDYAYVKLRRKSNRPVLQQSRSGFEDKKSYFLHKFNPVRVVGGIGGHFQKVKCLAVHDSAIFSAPLDRLSQTSFLADCNVIPGNSGSPVLAEDGTVRGVIYAFLNKTQARTIFSKNASEVPEEENLADLNVASNFACLNLSDDLDGKGIPDACGNTADRLSRNRAEANKRRSVSIRPVVEKLIEKNSSGRFDLTSFGWDLNISNSEQLGLIGLGVPYCVKPRVAEYLVDKKADLNRPLFYVRGNYDRYLRATHLTPIWHGLTRSAETIRVKRLESSEAFWVEISNRDGAQVNFNAQLMPCL